MKDIDPSGSTIWRGAQALGGDISDLARAIWAVGPGTLERVWTGQLPPGAPETEAAARQTATTFGFGVAPKGALATGVGRLYHGAARPFEPEPGAPLGRMRIDKALSGEGYHAEGFGGYVSEEPKVAEYYRRNYGQWPQEEIEKARQFLIENDIVRNPSSDSSVVNEAIHWGHDPAGRQGFIMEGELPGAQTEEFLRWDLPLSQQSNQVKIALRKVGIDPRLSEQWTKPELGWSKDPSGYEIYGILSHRYGSETSRLSKVGVQNPFGDPEVANALKLAGIRGVRYPNEKSWNLREENKTFNYSVFNPETINWIKRYGIPALVGGGGAGVAATQNGSK